MSREFPIVQIRIEPSQEDHPLHACPIRGTSDVLCEHEVEIVESRLGQARLRRHRVHEVDHHVHADEGRVDARLVEEVAGKPGDTIGVPFRMIGIGGATSQSQDVEITGQLAPERATDESAGTGDRDSNSSLTVSHRGSKPI